MRYCNYFCCGKTAQRKVRKIYEASFPKEERFPFWLLVKCSTGSSARLFAIIDRDTDKLVGMTFLVFYDDITYCMYLAIDKEFRNKGIGSQILYDLALNYHDTSILLCIEKPENVYNIKSRRKAFYLRNGFYETGCYIADSGVNYEFLTSTKNLKITADMLKKRYTYMSDNILLKFIIKHTFDSDIKFIE